MCSPRELPDTATSAVAAAMKATAAANSARISRWEARRPRPSQLSSSSRSAADWPSLSLMAVWFIVGGGGGAEAEGVDLGVVDLPVAGQRLVGQAPAPVDHRPRLLLGQLQRGAELQ